MTDEAKDPQAQDAEEKPKRRRRARAKSEGDAAEAKAQAASKRPRRTRAKAKTEEAKEPEAKPEEAKAEEPKDPKAAKGDEAETPKPAPRRRDGAEVPAGAAQVRAQARYVRTSARKARLVCDHIRGKSVDEARAILDFAPRSAARDWSKLLESAVANAEHNHELVGDELKIKDAHADEGPTLKRYRPRAMGRATRIRKRTAHLSITLTPKETA
jgi:ribosomal protein L22